jgi:hypothetical protein
MKPEGMAHSEKHKHISEGDVKITDIKGKIC